MTNRQNCKQLKTVFCKNFSFERNIFHYSGIQEHRDADKLVNALEHIKNIEAHKNASGIFEEYSLEELHKILVEENWCSADDLKGVVNDFLEIHGI